MRSAEPTYCNVFRKQVPGNLESDDSWSAHGQCRFTQQHLCMDVVVGMDESVGAGNSLSSERFRLFYDESAQVTLQKN